MNKFKKISRYDLFKDAFRVSNAEKSVLLASTFRSGSTFVANLIKKNGLHGLNLEKYNHSWKYINVEDAEFYESCLNISKSTTNGVFSSKIMWPHRNQLAKCLLINRKDSTEFAQAFPDCKWIYVRREDKFRQGISFWRAKKSGRWHVHKTEAEPVLKYDYQEIKACYNELIAHDALWEDFFIQASLNPFRIKYEDFQADVEGGLSALLEFMGDHRTNRLPFSMCCELKKQSDQISGEYYERFLEDSYSLGK